MVNQNHCQKCTEPINENALVCPHCGYEPSNQGKHLRSLLKLIGVVLCMTVIGAVIGVPLILLAEYSEKKTGKWKPTTKTPS